MKIEKCFSCEVTETMSVDSRLIVPEPRVNVAREEGWVTGVPPNIKRQGEKESFQRERREEDQVEGLSDQLLTSVAGGLRKAKAENSRA